MSSYDQTEYELEIPSYGHLWIGTFPDKSIYQTRTLLEHGLIPTLSPTVITSRRAAAKLMVMSWNRSFGVLGAEYILGSSGVFNIMVAVSDNEDIGLSDELATVVFEESIEMLKLSNPFGAGTLTFSHAIQHPFDSNKAVFRVLARMIIFVLGAQTQQITSEMALAQVKEELEEVISRY
jgi:hypothetical protein